MPEIDLADLEANTDYNNFKASDPQIVWFWNVMKTLTHEEKALFLQFVTGTSKVPIEGFSNLQGMRGVQKFNIHKAFGQNGGLPQAHTCFNQLLIPKYSSKDILRDRLQTAVENSTGFGMV